MNHKKTYLFLLLYFSIVSLYGQGKISGIIKDKNNDQPLTAVTVTLLGNNDSAFTITDDQGSFTFEDVMKGQYQLIFSHLGYQKDTLLVTLSDKNFTPYLTQELDPDLKTLEEIKIVAERRELLSQTSLSSRKIEQLEIITNPGSGSDIAKVMQILPGVATTSSFRNDLIIRGGSPAENSFYIDGIKVPVINHLSTQGASGGAISLLNADFIENAALQSGNFSANRSNALSSVFQFELADGDSLQPGIRLSAGANNLSLDSYGKLSDKTSYIASARRSYRQYILKFIGLAVYPIYNDFLFKLNMKPSSNHEITFLGLGAIDKFRVNDDINDSEIQAYLRESLPENDQWNYTVGVNNKVYTANGVWTLVASRSHLYNKATRNSNISGVEENSLNYESNEVNNRLETEYMISNDRWNFRIGGEVTQRRSDFDVLNILYDESGLNTTTYQSEIDYLLYGGHAQLGFSIIPDHWDLSVGFRVDGSDFAKQLNDISEQFSPRISTRIKVTNNLSINGGIGTYYQLPPDITLGYSENGILINQSTAKFIRSQQFVGGLSYDLPWASRLTIELFQKNYSNYPFNTRENISQANEGGDFGVAGNSPIISNGNGESRGLEILYKQQLYKNWFGSFSYTYSQSQFENIGNILIPSSWDARHIINMVVGKKLPNNWQIGINARYQSALPYTPFDLYNSSLVNAWNVNREGIRDFTFLNSERGKSTMLIDMRIDKKWDMNWGKLTMYLDLENILADADSQQVLVLDKTDNNGNSTEGPVVINSQSPLDAQRYKLKEIQNAEGVLIPTIGFIVEF